jgi:hypothetical protein
MSSVSNQDHPATIAFVELDPFNRPNVELLISLQRCEILRSRPAESNKVASKALETFLDRVIKALSVDRSKTIGIALAHRDQPKKASLA